MIITYKKVIYEDLPEIVQNAILEFTKDSVVLDDTSLTANQKTKIGEWLNVRGYKQV